ncbi:glycosyltransferase family 2 protein [Paenibacillus sp. MMS18-CY102]|uniref:glycosyltransferase family 2 protein n=1 Tax=Paenibacillus sp. MMS18-CY102 TaxID=2682849 RepID=UPI00136561D8|nr:glycosyltransferase family A protein [Paenibacillus sp. MMS18-CY102]MWC27293.1 glycosyltransferase [Paenibacillus sp. MMS18-CY102]
MPIERAVPSVSVIIPTWNAGEAFGELLHRLSQQSVSPHEIIVIDSSSTDGTAELARRAGAVVLSIAQQEFDHGGARNRAASVATGDMLVFMTQDALPADDSLLESLIRPLAAAEVAYAYARQLPYPDANLLERTARAHNYPGESMVKSQHDIPRMGIKAFFCSNVCSAMRRETFERMGKFDEPVMFNEDLLFSARCVLNGGLIAYVADAKVLHSHMFTLKQLYKRFYDNGVSIGTHRWIAVHAQAEKAGSGLLRSQLQAIWKHRKPWLIARLVLESVSKYVGYKRGLRRGLSLVTPGQVAVPNELGGSGSSTKTL